MQFNILRSNQRSWNLQGKREEEVIEEGGSLIEDELWMPR